MIRKVILILVIILVVGGLFFFYWQLHHQIERTSPLITRQVPVFSLTDLQHPHHVWTQEALQGRPILLNVWGSWCPSCIQEMPQLLRLQQAGVHIIGLNYKDQREAAEQFLAQYGNPFVVNIYDPQGKLAFDLGVYGAPESFLINAQGVICYHHTGFINSSDIEKIILPLWRQITKTCFVTHSK